MIQRDLAECSEEQRSSFARVAISPAKWRQSPYGDEGGVLGLWPSTRIAFSGSTTLNGTSTSRRSKATAKFQKTGAGATTIRFNRRYPI
jgi:hypothetical protein